MNDDDCTACYTGEPEDEHSCEPAPSVPTAHLRATVALLGHGEMTPTAKRLLLQLVRQYEEQFKDDRS